jgi:hypothetical protein
MPGSMTYNTSWIDALIQEPQLSIEIQNGKNRHVRFTHDSDDSDYEPTIEDEASASADSNSDDSDYEPSIEDEASDGADSDSDDSDYEPSIEDEASDGADSDSDASADSDSDDSDYEPSIEDEASDSADSNSDDDSDSDFYASEPGCRVPTSYICTNPKFFKSVFSTSLNGKNIHTRFLYYDDL